MLTIKVLGPGCYNCQMLAQQAVEALEAVAQEQPQELEVTILKVTEREEIAKYPILFTPGLVINEKLVSAGRIPSTDEIKGWLTQALAEPA
ncbi:MAG: thioredoxin family protein [Anaerolineales bacterium]|nr:MAG: thioredoxin family protein [Anaerolineales bacterium]